MRAFKICIRVPNHLGDLLISTAFVEQVLLRFPQAQVDLIVPEGLRGLPLPQRGEILGYNKQIQRPWAFGRALKQRGYDLFYLLPPSFSSALMAFASGAPARIGHRESFRGFLLTQAVPYRAEARSRHLIQEYLELLGKTGPAQPRLELTPTWVREHLGGLSLPKGFIVLAPGAIYGPAKQWPLAYWQALASRLTQAGHPVVVVGMEGDYPFAEAKGVLNLTGKTKLLQLVALLSEAKALVSNDSGAMHLGAALRLPQVALFGSTSPIWTGPLNPLAKVVSLNLDCSPCFKRVCPLGHTNCQRSLTLDAVWGELAACW